MAGFRLAEHNVTVHEKILAALRGNPEAGAIEFAGEWRAWREIQKLVRLLDAALEQHGLGAGARIGLVARNRPQHVAAFAGLLAAQRNAVMIYSAQSPEAIAADLEHLRLPAVIAGCQDWTPAVISAAKAAASLGLMLTGEAASPIEVVPGLERPGAGVDRRADPRVAMELLSSGTTGAPKRVPLLARTFAAAVEDASAVYASGRAEVPAAPNVVFHPLGNVAGVTFLIPFLVDARPVVLLEKFSLPHWLDAVTRHRPARVSLPPAALRMILDQNVPQEALSSFASIGVGAAALDPDLQRQFEETYGIPLLAGYGATEFCGVVANWSLPLHQKFSALKRGSAGQARPGVALRVVDPVSSSVLPAGELGLLEAKLERAGPDWIRTTDQAVIDEDGFLYLRGRADNAVNRGGFKVLPEEVARVLRQHPGVADAVVIGIKDARLGEVPVAVVELRDITQRPSEDALLTHAKSRLLAYQVPVKILVLDALPRNPSMKPILPEIRALFEA
jgi:long-chain acyl-CoA synthetase